jgi:hypothetical protein
VHAGESVLHGPAVGEHEAIMVMESKKGPIRKFIADLKENEYVMYKKPPPQVEGKLPPDIESSCDIDDGESFNFEGSDLALQLITLMVSYRLNNIFLTDGQYYLLLWLDFNNFKGVTDGVLLGGQDRYTIIPMRYKCINSFSPAETLNPLAFLLSTCMTSAGKTGRQKRYRDVVKLRNDLHLTA